MHNAHVTRHTSHVVAAAVKPSLQALLVPFDPTLSPNDDAGLALVLLLIAVMMDSLLLINLFSSFMSVLY
jgi:hypothetical protein